MTQKESIKQATEYANKLIAATSCCKEAKAAAEKWLASIGTDDYKKETAAFIKELQEDIEPIDDLIAFTNSAKCKEIFGERANDFAAHARALKESGAKYCDCPACAACEAILALKDNL